MYTPIQLWGEFSVKNMLLACHIFEFNVLSKTVLGNAIAIKAP
ncbi:hypothetical protein [Nostoc sp.]